jgi:hypothetical protein
MTLWILSDFLLVRWVGLIRILFYALVSHLIV